MVDSTEVVLLRNIARSMDKLVDSQSATAKGASGRSSMAKVRATRAGTSDVDRMNRSAKEASDTLKYTTKYIDDLGKSTKEQNKLAQDVIKTQSDLVKQLVQNENLTNKAQDKLKVALIDIAGQSSTLGGQMVKNVKNMKDLEIVIDETGDYLERFGEILQESNKEKLREIESTDELIGALESLARSETDMNRIIDIKAGLESSNNEIREEAQRQLIAMADETEGVARDMKNMRKDMIKVSRGHVALAEATHGVNLALMGLSNQILGQHVTDLLFGRVGKVVAAIALFSTAIFDAYKDFLPFAKAGLAGEYLSMGFLDLSKQALHLQLDLKDFAAILEKNSLAVAAMGVGSFASTLNASQDALVGIGLGYKEAAEGIAGFTAIAHQAGVNMSDQSALNAAIAEQVDSFKTLKAITGESVEQFNSTNKSILDSESFQRRLLKTDKARRKLILQSVVAERKRLAQLGLTTDQQAEIIKKTEDLLGSKVADRFSQAAAVIQAAAATGQTDLGASLREIILKGQRATPEEREELTKGLMSLSGGLNTLASGSLGQENLANALLESLSKAGLDLSAQQAAEATAQTKALTDEQVQSKVALMSIDQNITDIANYFATAKAAIDNPLAKIAAGIGAMAMFWMGGKFIGLLGSIFLKGVQGLAGIGTKVRAAGGIGSAAAAAAASGKAKVASMASGAAKAGRAGMLAGAIGGSSLMMGMKDKMAGMKGGNMGRYASIAGKGLKFLGPLAMLASGGIDATMGAMNAADTFGVQQATLGQKVAGGVGGLLSGLTFGLADGGNMAKGIYDFFGGNKPEGPSTELTEGEKTAEAEGPTVQEQMNMQTEELRKMVELLTKQVDILTKQLSASELAELREGRKGSTVEYLNA